MKALIFGAKGNLGCDLVRVFSDAGHIVVPLDREMLDVTDAEAVRAMVTVTQPNVIINVAAWNNVDAAEDPVNREKVFALNEYAPAVMAAAAKDVGAKFVHYSSDYVFEGSKPEGYLEHDEPTPVSVYGQSKAAGEGAVLTSGARAYVIRTSKLFGQPGTSATAKPSFVSVMCKLAATKPELSIVNEEVGMPTYTRHLAEATLRLVSEEFEPGIFHLVNEGPGVTWYDFAGEFFGLLGVTTPRKPVPMSAFPRPAKRPLYAALKNTKFPPLPHRVEALKAFFAEAKVEAQ